MLLPLALSSAISYSYVASIKVAEPLHIKNPHRDDRAVIEYRLRRVTELCFALMVAVPILVTYVLRYYPTLQQSIRQLGIVPGFTNTYNWKYDLWNILLCFGKMCILYCGPLVTYMLSSPSIVQDMKEEYASLWGFRDHLFAPVTEELIYRALILCILQPVVSSTWALTVYTPMLFGLAHLHHGWSLYKQGTSLVTVLFTAAFQFLYTTVFGILANRVYLESGNNLWCAIVTHSTCNLGGFPSFEIRKTHARFFYVYLGLLVLGLTIFVKII